MGTDVKEPAAAAQLDPLVMPAVCPFCGEKRISLFAYQPNRFRCGTIGPNENDEYQTGTECDKTCFRNGFLRCHDLLVRIVDGATAMAFRGDGWVVPESLMDEIRKEVEQA